MLPKNRRIPRKDFPYILKTGKRFNSPHFLLYVAKNEQENKSKFSFSVSKKVYKKASDRNKYRRRGYSAVSKQINNIADGHLYFFSFKKGKYPVKFTELQDEIISLFRSCGVLI